ncbi:LacI family DNA-binding transcriptional regulator [Microbacterium sp. NPDC078428]|uniref:LacI family DNA-binding transcriptional regulator n=1 Tax=Microbacterium sp. NPDC078428 TaxID=3364190 RepID=UPI0037CAF0B4
MSTRRPTLADVAALAGVSVATVSKVVNARSDVASTTRTRVLHVLGETGYANPVARAEADGYRRPAVLPGRTPQILVLLPGIETMYSATVLHGIIAGALSLGAHIVTRFGTGAHDSQLPPVADVMLPVDCIGIIAVTHTAAGLRSSDASTKLPVVAIDPWEDHPAHWMTMGATNWTGGKSATDHLLELGHRRIGWLGGPALNEASAERLHGYRAALQSAGVPIDASVELNGDFDFEFGRTASVALLERADRPTALVAANDEIAIGAIDGARSLGLSVPADVSITGFDDTPQASWSAPKLTSVRQPLADMGRMAVSMILDTVRGSAPESRHIQLVTRLIVRESTAAPRPS